MAETNTAVPAAPAPAPITRAVPATPSQPKSPAPPLPKAQEASLPPATKTQPADQKPKVRAERPAPTPEESAQKLADEMFGGAKEAASEPAKAPEAPRTAPATPPAKETPPTAQEKGPFDGMELPSDASEAQKTNFRKMKETASAEVNRLKNEYAAQAKELETYKKATPADLQEAQRLKTELQAAQDKLAVYDVSSHPDFQRQYTEPKKKALAVADELAKDYQVPNAGELKALIDLPRPEFAKRLSEMAKDMPPFDQNKFFNSMDEARRLQGEEKGALSKAGELRQALQAKSAQEARTAFESSRSEFTTRVPALDIPEGTDPERADEIRAYNTAREDAIKEAEKFTFGRASDREVADIATRAAALNVVAHHVIPTLQKDLGKSNALLKEALAELAAIKGKKSPGSFTAAEAPSAPDVSKMDARQLAEHMFKTGQ